MDFERRFSDVLSEFARTLGTDFPIQAILDHLVERIADVLPVSAAGVTLITDGAAPRYVAASDPMALRFEQLQTELGEGPCTEAYSTGAAVVVADLRAEVRFAGFCARAVAGGLAAVFTFPLRQGHHQLGALDLYRDTPGPLDPRAMAAAQTLADVAAAYLINAQARVDLWESSERARQNSLHDELTGLPNRTMFVQRLDHAIARCSRSDKMVAILFADLDRFKAVNDTYGHHVGDELLVAVARRLNGLLRPGDTLARLAGDEFLILCEDLDDASQVEPLAARIDEALGRPFVLSGIEVEMSASVGIAFAGPSDEVPERVLQNADTAMYQAKRRGGARHGIIDLREQRLSDRRARLNLDLRGASGRGELHLDYQPIVAVDNGRAVAVEALLRWAHPALGAVAPEAMIPLAEQTQLIGEIGAWVLERACAVRRRWAAANDMSVAVNVSSQQLLAPGFVRTVTDSLSTTGTDPGLLILELTTSVLLHGSDRVLGVLGDLEALGVRIALDDFGTGYSSLGSLKSYPIDIVKIDRSFIADLDSDRTNRLIVAAVVGLAHGLGMTVVAEGVESAAQHQVVAELGCDWYQGFFFARPLPADSLDLLMPA